MSLSPESIRLSIKENGWRQGSFLAADFAKEIYGDDFPEGGLAIVVNQTCDLVNEDFIEEPYFETMLFQVPPKGENQALKIGLSPRKIQLAIREDGKELIFEAQMASKRFVCRRKLLEKEALAGIEIEPQSFPLFRSWLSKRYNRYAKPDDFDALLREADARKRKIPGAMKRLGDLLVAPYIKIEPDNDLSDNQQYSVEVMLVLDTSKCGPDEDAIVTQQGNKIASVLRTFCKKVEVDTIEDSKFSLQASRFYNYWDFDQYSLEDPNPVDIR